MQNQLHENCFDVLLRRLVTKSGVSRQILAKILERIMFSAPSDVARIDIAEGTMLVRPTPLTPAVVTKATKAMLEEGLIAKDPLQVSQKRAGRPVEPLRLGGNSWAVMGIAVTHEDGRPVELTGIITNLRVDPLRDVLAEKAEILPPEATFETLDSYIHKLASELINEMHENDPAGPGRKLLGIGIQVAAPTARGVVIGGTHLGVPPDTDVDLATPLQRALNVPVVVDNDVNLLAVRETYRPTYPELNQALITVFDDGVGAALIIEGRVYRGGGGMAGEPGHQYVTGDLTSHNNQAPGGFADPCHCKKRNHVDCFAVPERIRAELGAHVFEDVLKLPAYSEGSLTLAGLTLQRAGEALGQGIASLVNIANPSRVVLQLRPELAAAPEGSACAEYLPAIENALKTYSFARGARDARAGKDHLTVVSMDPNPHEIHRTGALCAAIRVLDEFVQHAYGRDGCHHN